MTLAAEVARAVASIERDSGPLDMLVTSAGAIHPGTFETLSRGSPDVFEAMMRLNWRGTLNAIQAVTPGMLARGSGGLVGISSTAAFLGLFGYAAYGPSKSAVRCLYESLRPELGPRGLYVACAFPPDTETPGLSAEKPLRPPETEALCGSIRALPPERVAHKLVDGIERRRPRIFCEPWTPLLAKLSVLLPSALDRYQDRIVKRATR